MFQQPQETDTGGEGRGARVQGGLQACQAQAVGAPLPTGGGALCHPQALASRVNPVILFSLPAVWTQDVPNPPRVLTPQEPSLWFSLLQFPVGLTALQRDTRCRPCPAGPVGNQLLPGLAQGRRSPHRGLTSHSGLLGSLASPPEALCPGP